MGRTRNLLTIEKKRIRELAAEKNHSYRQIADKVGVSLSSVYRTLKSSPKRSNVKKGPKGKLSERDRRALTRLMVKIPTSSASLAVKILNFRCSPQTVRRALIRNEFANVTLKKEKGISKKNQEKRLTFARDHATWIDEWMSVVFSDEKKWNLTGPDGLKRVWMNRRRNINIAEISKSNKSIMVWGAISASGPVKLVLMKGKYDSKKYVEMIKENLFFSADSIFPTNSIFQQDNAPIHVSNETLNWLDANEIDTLEWPPQSPDLSPIENIWALLTSRVYANGKVYNSTSELWTAVKREWDKLTAANMAPYYSGMHDRILNVIQEKGKKIDH